RPLATAAARADGDPAKGQADDTRGPTRDVGTIRPRAEDQHRPAQGRAAAAARGKLRQSRSDPPDRAAPALHAWRRTGWEYHPGLESNPAPGAPVLPMMISRFVLAVVLAVVMFVCGTSAYLYLGSKQSKAAVPAQKPTAATPRAQALSLPGAIYLAQSGALSRLSAGRFHQLTPEARWTMPRCRRDARQLLSGK